MTSELLRVSPTERRRRWRMLLGPATDTGPLQQPGRALLLVSDAPAMLGRGVMLNLQVEDGRVVFDVGLAASHRAGLEISTKLLRLARFVQRS